MSGCTHDRTRTVCYGVVKCAKCNTTLRAPQSTSLTVTRSTVLAHGDPCYVTGIGDAVFYYVDEDNGGTYAHVKRAHIGGMANVTLDRIRPARRRFARRVEESAAI